MPIDISLLRPPEEGGNIKEVEKWQVIRLLGENFDTEDIDSTRTSIDESQRRLKDGIKILLSTISQLDKERRISLKECCQSRSKLKKLQSSLAPKKKKLKDVKSTDNNSNDDGENLTARTVREEIEKLKKVVIPLLAKEVEVKTKELDILCPKIMNSVITEEGRSLNDVIISEPGRHIDDNDTNDSSNICLDPLYCIDGYGKTSIPTWTVPCIAQDEELKKDDKIMNDGSQEKAYLCNNGALLYDALCTHAKTSFQSSCNTLNLKYEQKILNIPQSIPLETNMANALLGCKSNYEENHKLEYPNHSNDDVKKHTNVPSNITLALLHQNKTFTDRELPKIYLCNSQITSSNNECSTRVGLKQLPLIHAINQIEVFAISTCNLSISAGLQNDIVRGYVEFYRSLLTNVTDLKNLECDLKSKQQKSTPLIRIQITSPCNLGPNEARRVTIEGYLQSKKEYICLGHVSNYTDFVSRGVKIKCGGGHGQPVEFAHLIHGKFCDQNVLNWMLENNIGSIPRPINPNLKKKMNGRMFHDGIIIPSPLVRFMRPITGSNKSSRVLLFLPFQREIVKGKGGKITTKEIKNARSQVWLDLGICDEKECHDNIQQSTISNDEQNHKEVKLTLPSAADEASCNPYNFLPFTFIT